MSVRMGLKIKAEALACQEFMLLTKKKKGNIYFKSKITDQWRTTTTMCGLRKGENVCILSSLIASLKSDISACLKAILETFLTVLIKIQVVCYITKLYDGISASTQQS